MSPKRRRRDWMVKRLPRKAVRAWSQFTKALVAVGAASPEEASKKVDHINYIQIGDCLHIQVVFTDGTTMDIKICEEKPKPEYPA